MELTKEHLTWALCSLMDGMKEHEIQEMTGYTPETCALIWSVYGKALNAPAIQPTNGSTSSTEAQ